MLLDIANHRLVTKAVKIWVKPGLSSFRYVSCNGEFGFILNVGYLTPSLQFVKYSDSNVFKLDYGQTENILCREAGIQPICK